MDRKTVQIKFFTGVNEASVKNLMSVIEQKLGEGVRRVVILLSSPGGNVFHGLSAYNFLKGIPVEVITHNFGSVDSMGAVIYCAGSKRYCVPHARFLLHAPSAGFPQPTNLEEKQLEERLKGLKLDIENIAGVIAATTGKSEEQVYKDMLDRAALNPEDAIKYGLVHEIREDLIEPGSELITIQ
jgi:ATP-dependent Clp endopeptidase proteolytic subunit ClpP